DHTIFDSADFIYQRYSRFNFSGVVLSLITGLPLMLEFNGSEVWVSRNWDPVGQIGLLKRYEFLNLFSADVVFVVSQVQEPLLKESNIRTGRVVVNSNGVDTAVFRSDLRGVESRARLGVADKIVVGFLGTFGPWHGAPVLAEAATKLGTPAQFHF